MYDKLRVAIHLVQPDGLVQLQVRLDRTGIVLLVDPLHGEILQKNPHHEKPISQQFVNRQILSFDETDLLLAEPANLANLPAQPVVRDGLVDVGDHHLATVGDFHLNLVAGTTAAAAVVALVRDLDRHDDGVEWTGSVSISNFYRGLLFDFEHRLFFSSTSDAVRILEHF